MFYNVFWHIIKAEFSIYSTFFMYFFNKSMSNIVDKI